MYCTKCGSENHPTGGCPSLTNKNFNAQQWRRMNRAGMSAARHAPHNPPKKKGCLFILVMAVLVVAFAFCAGATLI